MSEDKLQKIRERIDAIDSQIQSLISERAQCAREVAEVKLAGGEEAVFYRPEREAQVLRTVKERNEGPLSGEEMARLFREIMSACLALEQTMQVAFLGPEGTFTQAAALKHFGHSINTLPMGAIDEVFREVESDTANYGVVPIENSTEGVINHTLDMFMQSSLQICGEVELRIHHHVLGTGESLDNVSRVYSHQQSLAQCREWLDAHLPRAERIAVSSNAEAARRVLHDKDAVAIAGDTAADIYELNILIANIEDEPDNTTRFLIIGKQQVQPSGKDKTSLMVSAKNQAGTLYRLLAPLVNNSISMTRLESRPSRKGMWDYVFFIDIEGHVADPSISQALQELESEAAMLKVLGSYPCAVL